MFLREYIPALQMVKCNKNTADSANYCSRRGGARVSSLELKRLLIVKKVSFSLKFTKPR